MILFSDPAKQAKLEEAIRRGFIARQIDNDGIVRYILTQQGGLQWLGEKQIEAQIKAQQAYNNPFKK